ncbi:MAG TPA: GAF domain-containing protein [Coleofasciculaceae cyanobacterium]|jgi:GAF domain-containing protein
MGLQKEPSGHERQLVALGRVLQALREEGTVDGLVKAALDYLQAEFHYALIWIGLYDRVDHRLLGKGGYAPAGDDTFLKQRHSLNPGDLLEQVVIQQRPIGIPDLREESRAGEWRRAAQKYSIQGTIIFPIRHKEDCFGVVLLGSPLWGTSPHADEKARLSMVLGALADGLYQIEDRKQRQMLKRPDLPLLSLLAKLRSLPNLKKRLDAVIEETHRFVLPDRTSIYWYEPQQRYFWKRQGNRMTEGQSDLRIPVQEVNGFYQALTADQVLSIGEAQGALKADLTGRIMQYLQARSLIAAPILYQGELRGFLAVEGNEARLWSEEEKSFIRGVAQMIALVAPLEEMENTVQQVKLDQVLTAEVTRALYSEEDWKAIIQKCADQVCQRLNTERFLVLLYDSDLKKFEICYQQQPKQRRPIAQALENLNPVDWQMLERSTEAVAVENLEEDLKLMAWRQVFLDSEVRSLLVCSTSMGKAIEGLVVLGHETTRSWSRSERDLVRVVGQQIGLLLHQFQLQRQTDRLQKNYQAVQWGLTTMQQAHRLDRLEIAATQQIAQLLQSPLVTLITWLPGRTVAQLTAPVVSKRQFEVAAHVPVPVYTDVLVQWALQTDGLLTVGIDDISPETRQWLCGADIGQVLVMTLRTDPEHEPAGIILVGDVAGRAWTEQQLSAFGTLTSQLGWGRRYLLLTEILSEQREKLEQLNWYKQRRLEETYRILGTGVRRLNELSHQKDGASSMRYQQILRHLGGTLTALTPVLKHEQWQFQCDYETIPLASLLRRSLERLDSLIKQRQLWSQVHNDASVNVGGDIPKIEFVLLEVLTAACYRSVSGGRLDIWCRQIDSQWLELSITDNGTVEPRLLEELEMGRSSDLLLPSTLEHPPGLHLAICKSVMARLGGEFNFYRLEDGRLFSGLLIPIAAGTSQNQIPRTEGEVTGFF